ncbi:MAG: hypothetical protein H6527_00140 [Actinobacteria bacterium]|nr:hypothetical protein [Actinomycetota bacterium]MCB9423484.1 hypothetical protein [Actinomycetota bacterium]
MTREVVPIGALFERVERRGRSDLPLLSVYRELGVVPREGRQDNNNRPGDDLDAYKVVEPGDLVLNKMKTWQGSLGISQHHGIVSPAYFVGRARQPFDCRFVHHLLRSQPLIAEYAARSKGIRPSQWDLPWDEFKTIKVEMPPVVEQRAIADYLDAETARIDALIAKKQQLITLLEGRRLSVLEARLHHELTGHPAVPVRHLASISGGLTLGGATVRGAEVRRPYLRVANVQDGYLDLGDVAEIDVSPEQARRFALQDGDVLMLEGNGNPDNLGRGTIWRSEIPGCLHQNHIHAVRPDRSLLVPEFFNFVVRTPFARSELTGGGGQVSIATLSKSDIAALRLPLPPIAKQRAIVDSVRRELSYVDASLRAAAQQIELLAEHRQALITATVTGQHSVPGNS